MYIQLTTRCNMRCPHCCFSCTSRGQDMSLDTFKKAMWEASERCDCVTLGGGEPTIWRHFKEAIEWLHQEIFHMTLEELSMITNGSRLHNTMRMIHLKEMVEELSHTPIISVRLSNDIFHDYDKVHPKVREWFEYHPGNYHNISRAVAAGRGMDIPGTELACPCPDIFILPSGIVKWCACSDASIIGHINDDFDLPEHYYPGCYHEAPPIGEVG